MSIKVLGPAGGREAFDAAIAAGSDEIYMGLSGYGARQYAENFTTEGFIEALADAHKIGVRLSLTLNTLMAESEIERVLPELDLLIEAELDSVIVQDWGVVRLLRRRYPNLAIHGSTQMGLGSADEVQFAAQCGLSRVVLPRELSFDEIVFIRKTVPEIELEVFCSGALCLGCSGKCYLSSYIGGRSGNRGCCAQPCRQFYRIEEDAESSLHGAEGYFLSLRDQLFSANDVIRLNNAGVDVLKIEGRMKSPAYVFEMVSRYRALVDAATGGKHPPLPGELESIKRIFNRGYGPGFLNNHDPDILNPHYASHYGYLTGEIMNGKIHLSEPLVLGDGIVYLDANLRKISGRNVSQIQLLPKLYGDRSKRVVRAEPDSFVILDRTPPNGARYLYKTLDLTQQKETIRRRKSAKRQWPIVLSLTAKIGHPLSLTLTVLNGSKQGVSVTRRSGQLLVKSNKQHLDRESLLQSIDRFGDSPFFLHGANFDFEPDAFVPKSLLNRLRRETVRDLETLAFAEIDTDIPTKQRRSYIKFSETVVYECPQKEMSLPSSQYAAAVRTLAQGVLVFSNHIPQIYRLPAPIRFSDEAGHARLERELISTGSLNNPPFAFRPIAGNLTEALFYEERGIPFTADASFNVANFEAGLYLIEKFPHLNTLYLSNELGRETLLGLGKRLQPLLADRSGRIGHTIYGHPIAMYTRKTLFERRRTRLNSLGRHFIVLRNKELFADKEEFTPVSGSSVFYEPPLNLLAEVHSFPAGWELRFDFTVESPAKISHVLQSWMVKQINDQEGVGYGFDHPIF